MRLEYLRQVTTLRLDAGQCVGCGRCIEVCPHAVFSVSQRRARLEHLDACMECGACAVNCPAGALSVNAGVGCAAAVLETALRGTGFAGACSSSSCCGETRS